MDSEPRSTGQVLAAVARVIEERLPEGWGAQIEGPTRSEGGNYLAILASPDGQRADLDVEVRSVVERRDVARLSERTRESARQGVVFARYLSVPVQEALAAAGISYADATGNVRVENSRPGLFLRDVGATKDPWRSPGRPRGTLRGAPAARVVRALVDYAGPLTARRIREISGGSVGTIYRVVDYLDGEGLIERDGTSFVVTRWPELLRLWSRDYDVVSTNRVTRWVEPRGMNAILSKAQQTLSASYVLTGSIASETWIEPYAPVRAAMVFTRDASGLAKEWGLLPAEGSANVLLVEPGYDVVMERAIQRADGAVVAAPAQVVVDQLTGPGRAPSEGEALMAWMEKNESQWRR